MNTAATQILMERAGQNSIQTGHGQSVYFALHTLGAFLGAFLLAKFSSSKFYQVNVVIAVAAFVVLIIAGEKCLIFGLYGVIGFTIANAFPIIFGMAIHKHPDKANEISGLMITGVFEGAVLPFFIGITSDLIGS